MRTPIADFIKKYAESETVRFHMPGHKGRGSFGFEKYDITEVKGADSLYEAEGIIAESEENASRLFGSGKTLYSTEGSSQCIRAMLHLAAQEWARKNGTAAVEEKPLFIAARNVHKAFIYGAALEDADVKWLYDEGDEPSLCACRVIPETVEEILAAELRPVAAVYITCPDFLGNMNDVKKIADICHRYGTLLLVDNAHGAYLHFLEKPVHPLDLGADMCCDSAHKTLPVITGGAYLHIGKDAPGSLGADARQAMALFGSTSPSYLIMGSLDECNRYLNEKAREEFPACAARLASLSEKLEKNGWDVKRDTDPLRLTLRADGEETGILTAEKLRAGGVECEYADPEYVVLMVSPFNSEEDLARAAEILGVKEKNGQAVKPGPVHTEELRLEQKISIRKAVFAPSEMIDADKSAGRVCAAPAVSCPPAVPIAVSGEIIDEKAVAVLKHYGIEKISCVCQKNW